MSKTTNMKNLVVIMALVFAFASCKGPSGDKAKVTDAQEEATASSTAKKVNVDKDASVVTWVGSKPTGSHNGIIKLSSGDLSVENGQVVAGEFVMDMNTVESQDKGMPATANDKLGKHLKSADFFDVEQFPTAKFVIVKVDDIANRASAEALQLEGATHYVTGNLTMKGTEKGVSFPAIITVDENGVSAKAEFTIKRTDWGMSYGNDKSFGDKFIHPEVKVGFDVAAK